MGWGAAIGGALSAAGGLASSAMGARAVKMNYKRRYQWQIEDMKKAGLNPMLAISHGAPVPQKSDYPNIGEAAVKGAAAGSAARQQYKAVESQVELNKANTAKAAAEAAKTVAETPTAGAFEARYTLQNQVLEMDLSQALEKVYNTQADTNVKKETIGLLRAQIAKYGADTDLTSLETHQKAELFPLLRQVLESDAARAGKEKRFWDSPVGTAKPYTEFGVGTARGLSEVMDNIYPWRMRR